MSAVLKAQEPSARYLAALQPPLVEHFELVASAPGGVARLRELILMLAVRGRLVPQDAPKARNARTSGGLASKLDEGDRPPTSDADSMALELPVGWQWARLSDLGEFRGGKTPSTQQPKYWNGAIPWITPKDMKQLRLSDSEDRVTQRAIEDGLSLIPPHSVLIVVRSGILRRTVPTAINKVVTTVNQDLKALVLKVPESAPYVQLMIRGFEAYILENLTKVGTTVESIRFEAFSSQQFPMPPFAEQARIVARVEELMRLCDALEAQGRLEGAQHAQLLNTLLGSLTDSASLEERASNWHRVAAHFDRLLDRPEAVDALEQAILQLAVRGRLVPQDANDEPAAVLLQRMSDEGHRLIAAGKARREPRSAAIARVEAPFDLPHGWEWARFDQLVDPDRPISYGVLVPGPDVADGVPFVRIADLSITSPAAKPEKKISAAVDAQYQRTRLEGGEILMGVVGSIGKLGVAPQSWSGANIARAICRIVPAEPIDREFMLLLLQSEFMQRSFVGDTRTLAQPTLNVGLIRASPAPVPPLAEQKRIVARVNQLRRLCTDLRERLLAQQATQTHLADALAESVTIA